MTPNAVLGFLSGLVLGFLYLHYRPSFEWTREKELLLFYNDDLFGRNYVKLIKL